MSSGLKASLAAVAAGAVVILLALLASPALVTRYAAQNARPAADLRAEPKPRYAGPEIQVAPVISLHVPAVLRLSAGDRLSISIGKTLLGHSDALAPTDSDVANDLPRQWDTREVDRDFAVRLAVEKGLSIDPPAREVMHRFTDYRSLDEPPLTWHWSLSADEAGRHKLLLSGLPLSTSIVSVELPGDEPTALGFPRPTSGDLPDFIRILPDGTAECTILALTPLGLTATQDAVLKALQGLAGFLGVILAYPIFKRLFERPATGPAPRKRQPKRKQSAKP